jgi:hypothetical protein
VNFSLKFLTTCLTSFILIIPSSKIILANYGDPINPYHSSFEGFIFRQDNRTTYEYVNEHYQENDIVLIYGTPQASVMYANFKPDYRIWSGTTYTLNNKNYATGIPEVNNKNFVDYIINNNNRVWIITSYSVLSKTEMAPRVFHIDKSLIDQLGTFNDRIVYQSNDPSAKVYLIEK